MSTILSAGHQGKVSRIANRNWLTVMAAVTSFLVCAHERVEIRAQDPPPAVGVHVRLAEGAGVQQRFDSAPVTYAPVAPDRDLRQSANILSGLGSCEGMQCGSVGCEACAIASSGCDSCANGAGDCGCQMAATPVPLAKRIATAHKPLFYQNDFSYLCDPEYCDWYLGDEWKRRSMFGIGLLEFGGQYRARAHFESNHRGLGLTGNDDRFLLHRTRLYANWKATDDIRVFAEMIDAESNYENFAPRPIEVNRTDFLNLFVDANLLERNGRQLTARVGRQELLFGAQRVVSPLDWANTRRTFEGVRMTWKTSDWAIDGFWLNPMQIDNNSFDAPNRDQEFMGFYASKKAEAGRQVDTYFLRFLNGAGTNNFEYNTIGTRWQGDEDGVLWDFEGAYQFGNNTNGSDHSAGAATFGIGRRLSCAAWKPTVWAYYDWASGDSLLGAGNGYHHLFPLAHKYNGFMDLFGRRNLEDVNLLFTANPTDKIKLLAWYHYLFLETKSDSPYSVVMTPFNGGNAPASAELGHEIDLLVDVKLGARSNLVLGYSHFFSGGYFARTNGLTYRGDADFYYTQWSINF